MIWLLQIERQTIEKKMQKLDSDIKAKQAELAHLQGGWTEDTFVTGRMRQELGVMKQEWTALSQ